MRRRRAFAVAGGVAAALVALVALRIVLGKSLGDWVAARERTRFEREVGPLDPARFESPAPPPADNAVPALAVAASALELTAGERAVLRRDELEPEPDAELVAQIDALLTPRDASLAALAAAARRPASSFGPRRELFHGARLDLTRWLTAARLAAADGRRALSAGDAPRIARALDSLHGMATAVRREPIAVFAVGGAALETIELDFVRAIVANGADGATLDRLATDLEAHRELPDAPAVMHGEAVFGDDMLRRTPSAARVRGTPRERIEALLWPWSEGHVEAGYLAGWRELARYAETPQASWPSVEEIVADRQGPLRRWLDPTAPFETVRSLLFGNLLTIARRLQQLAAAEQLARLAVGVAAHAAREGELPRSLDAFPEATRPDPATGAAPRYAVATDGSARLEAPGALELVRADLEPPSPAHTHVEARRARLFVWTIPAPSAASR